MAEDYLGRDWRGADGEREKGAEFNNNIASLVNIYLQHSGDRVAAVDRLCEDGLTTLVDKKGKDAVSEAFPTVTRGTAGIVYRALLTTLVDKVRAITYGVTKDAQEQLDTWQRSIQSLHRSIMLLKKWSSRSMLAAVLKLSRQFLDHFLRHGMPLLDKVFR